VASVVTWVLSLECALVRDASGHCNTRRASVWFQWHAAKFALRGVDLEQTVILRVRIGSPQPGRPREATIADQTA